MHLPNVTDLNINVNKVLKNHCNECYRSILVLQCHLMSSVWNEQTLLLNAVGYKTTAKLLIDPKYLLSDDQTSLQSHGSLL